MMLRLANLQRRAVLSALALLDNQNAALVVVALGVIAIGYLEAHP